MISSTDDTARVRAPESLRRRSRLFGATLSLAWLGAVAAPAGAQESGKFYLGAGAGFSSFDNTYQGISYRDTPIRTEVFGGVQLRSRTAIELALTAFPDIRSGNILGSGIEELNIKSDYRAVIVRAMFSADLAEFIPSWKKLTVFGTLGAYGSRENRHVVELVSSRTVDDTNGDGGVAMGAGVIYKFSRVRLRASLEWLNGRYTDSGLQLGAEFRFAK
jgi:Outer membrane protein beta-barrel domain